MQAISVAGDPLMGMIKVKDLIPVIFVRYNLLSRIIINSFPKDHIVIGQDNSNSMITLTVSHRNYSDIFL